MKEELFRVIWPSLKNVEWAFKTEVKIKGQTVQRFGVLLEREHIGIFVPGCDRVVKEHIKRDTILIVDLANDVVTGYLVSADNDKDRYVKFASRPGIIEIIQARKTRRKEAEIIRNQNTASPGNH
jgi:hypothetical protein